MYKIKARLKVVIMAIFFITYNLKFNMIFEL